MHLRRYKSVLNFSPTSPSRQHQHQFHLGIPWLGNRDSCWAGLPPALVHMQVPVQPQFTHTLIFLKQHPISSGSWLFRTEKRSVACHQYNICPSPSLPVSLFSFTHTQNSLRELVPQNINPCSDPMCRSLPSNHLPIALILLRLPSYKTAPCPKLWTFNHPIWITLKIILQS